MDREREHKLAAIVPTNAFDGKYVMVTGADQDAGGETAILFSKYGAKVGLVGSVRQKLIDVARKCAIRPLCLHADLAKMPEVECVARTYLERFKKIDILVYMTYQRLRGCLLTSTLDEYDQMMNLNVRAAYYLTQLLMPALIKSKGCIVFKSSVLSSRPQANDLIYCVSKACIDMLMKSIALDYAHLGVRCNNVRVGLFETPNMYMDLGLTKRALAEYIEKKKRDHAMKRFGHPLELAHTILFLSSDPAGFITGAAVPIDGGRHVKCPKYLFS